jgi:hypothetical protein
MLCLCVQKNEWHLSIDVQYVQIMMREKLTLFFPLQVKNKPNDEVQFVLLFLNWVWSWTVVVSWRYHHSAILYQAKLFLYLADIFLYQVKLFLYLAEVFLYLAKPFWYLAELFLYLVKLFLYLAEIILYLAKPFRYLAELSCTWSSYSYTWKIYTWNWSSYSCSRLSNSYTWHRYFCNYQTYSLQLAKKSIDKTDPSHWPLSTPSWLDFLIEPTGLHLRIMFNYLDQAMEAHR